MANAQSFTRDEERRLFSTIRKFKDLEAQRDLNWMLLMRHTARRVETVHLLDIDEAADAIERGYMNIASHKQKGGKQGNAKGLNKAQEIYLVDQAKRALQELLRIRRQMIKRLGAEDVSPALILSRRGQRMSIRTYQQRMTHWCNEAKIVKASPHWLRHTWAYRRLQNATTGEALRQVQEVLGHEHITTTQVYTKPSRDDLVNAMQEAAQ